MFNLKDKIAVITGGANGIGAGITRCLKQAGAKVIILDLDDTNGKQLSDELDGTYMSLDITSEEQVNETIEKIIEDFGRIDILASNVGIYPDVKLENMTAKDWDKVFDINVKGMFFVCKPVLEQMKKQEKGRVILTSSITGPITGYPGGAAYGASKSAQLGFMRSAAMEYAKYNVTINAVQPGIIATESLLRDLPTLNEATDWIPAKRLGKPEDIGAAVTFFASDEAEYITAQSIVVDGGQIVPETPDTII